VLIVAMWIVLVLAGVALVFARSMRVELATSGNQAAGLEAEAVARGALRFILSELDGTNGRYEPDAAVRFEAMPVGRGYFWLMNASLSEDGELSWGLREESSRVNLNAAPLETLLKLPGMTAELAAAIVDWRDEDSEISPGGAESEYYLLLSDPCYCKNAPLETVEEVLLVRGATREILQGEDANRNGVLDPNENDADETEPADNRDGHLDRGLVDYVTVCSREPNTDAEGRERVNVNEPGSRELSELLREVVSEDRYFQLMDRVRLGRPYRNVLDFYFRAGLTTEEFSKVADRLTTSRERTVTGLVNVNTAPREVLLCLPGLEESDVDALMARRSTAGTDLSSVAWVTEVLGEDKAVAAADAITTRSYQFAADIVAVSGDGRAWRRYRAVVDARSSPPRVLLWQDLTALGWPLAEGILSGLRRGEVAEPSSVPARGGAG
jgi:type II secretory pathway component PulK